MEQILWRVNMKELLKEFNGISEQLESLVRKLDKMDMEYCIKKDVDAANSRMIEAIYNLEDKINEEQ